MGAGNILQSPVNILWRIEADHDIKHSADVAGALGGKYYSLMGTHYVWFDTGASVDPAPAGLTGLSVTIVSGDSASIIAGKVQTVIDANANFGATVLNDVVSVKAALVGEQSDSVDVDAGVIVTIVRKGKNFDLGLLEGDIEPSFDVSMFEIKSHQTADTVLGLLNKGVSKNEIETTILETTKSKMKEFFKIYGGVTTPLGGTEVIGVGTGSIGKSMLQEAARLELIPVTTVSSELSYNYNLMLALPIPSSLKFSGTDPRILKVSWKGFPDLSKNNSINTINLGDASQSGL